MKAASSSIAMHRRPRWPLRPLALSLACIGLAPAGAQIVPSGSTLVGGSATVGLPSALSNGGLGLAITQTSSRAILNWQSFSIGALDQVNINQTAGAASVLLNRVTGAQASTIAGKLTANGHVYLVNPAGVTFANGSQVSVGGLVASTLDIAGSKEVDRNATFMAGGVVNPETGRRELSFAGAADSTARIMVAPGATITASAPGGTVGLLGGLVRNEGQINVARGSVGLVSASKVSLDFDGDGLTQFIVPVDGMNTFKLADVQANPDKQSLDATTTAQLMNSGSITADGGRVALVGSSTLAQQVVNHSGTVRAASMSERGGEIVLQAREGGPSGGANQLVVTGALDADANAAGVAGGSIRTTGDDLRIRGSAAISASGGAGAANGNWTAEGRRNLQVSAEDPAVSGSRFITASVVGKTLGRNTNVTLSTTDGADVTSALVFGDNAKVQKTGGADATLRVNSTSNIDMRAGSAITSTAGTLNVEFNADSQGIAAATPPGNGSAAAAIRVDGATIDANGGDIRFFGQGVATGRAIGGQVKGLDADSPDAYRSGVWVNDSTLATRGAGQISLRGLGVTQGKSESFGVVVASASDNTGLRASGGSILIDAGTSDVRLDAGVAGRALLDVSSTTGAGGSISVDARNVLATNNGSDGTTFLADTRGVGQSGNVTLHGRAQSGVGGSGIVAMDPNLTIDASAGSAVGNAGEVRLLGERSLYAFGRVDARGGTAGGNGGFIETSGGYAIPETAAKGEPGYIGGGLLMSGFRADASAPAGKAGTWLIDPQNVTIQNGGATDTLPPGNPSVYVPLSDSIIQDTDITAALNAGTDVRITTGTGGAPDQGDIVMDDAQIVYNVAGGTRTLTL
ncbi:MAG: filamentous hemagglutinin N-terminal domain-containing protein, partial [Comamonadaceae bacterium]